MAVGQARKEVRPGDGPGIGIRDVDLHLADDDKNAGDAQRKLRRAEHLAEHGQIHLRRIGGILKRNAVAEGVEGQERTRQDLQPADDDPAGARA